MLKSWDKNMGLDFFGAAKTVNGCKIDCDATVWDAYRIEPGISYRNPRFLALWAFDARKLVASLNDVDLIARCYNRASNDRGKHYHAACTQTELLAVPTYMLPPVLQPDAALVLADDLQRAAVPSAPNAASYLRFWANRGHPVFTSY